jgi:hypothetical protein
MRWLKPNVRNSLWSLFGAVAQPVRNLLEDDSDLQALEDIREAMLEALGPSASREEPQLSRRVRYAKDLDALWYLRGELMQVLARRQGERSAARQLAQISAMFEGLLPDGMQSRPSPLN